MSTYYYRVCHDCKQECPAHRESAAGSGGLAGDENLPAFDQAHLGHHTETLSEHAIDAQDLQYDSFNPA